MRTSTTLPPDVQGSLYHLTEPQRGQVHRALTHYDAAEHADHAARAAQLAIVQICGGLAIGLYPYFPSLVDNCRPGHGPGWLCGARIATMVAATGAVVVGVVTGLQLVTQRRWCGAHRTSMAAGFAPQTPMAETLRSVLAAYAQQGHHGRQHIKEALWRDIGP